MAPFDGDVTEFEQVTKPDFPELKIAAKMREVLGPNGKNWRTPHCLLTAFGAAWVLAGAVGRVTDELDAIREAVGTTKTGSVAAWNDAPERTWADISAAIDRLETI